MLEGRTIRTVALGLAAMAGLHTVAQAAEPEVTLTIHHFLSPKSTTQVRMIEPWAEGIEKASDGRIAFEIFPSMSMGGKPPELYRQVRDGAADIVWTVIGYTPGVFPRSEAFELPTVHLGSAIATNMAIDDTFDLIAEDYEDIKPLLVHTHDGNALHMRRGVEEVLSLDAFQGIKLRTPSRTGAWMIEALGAEPVGMPVPNLPQALSKGVVDGALVPFEIFPPLKLAELTETSVEGRNKERFGTSIFLFGMNKERFEELPEDLQQIIEEHSGRDFARRIGEVWHAEETVSKRQQFESGGTILRLSEEVTPISQNGGKASSIAGSRKFPAMISTVRPSSTRRGSPCARIPSDGTHDRVARQGRLASLRPARDATPRMNADFPAR